MHFHPFIYTRLFFSLCLRHSSSFTHAHLPHTIKDSRLRDIFLRSTWSPQQSFSSIKHSRSLSPGIFLFRSSFLIHFSSAVTPPSLHAYFAPSFSFLIASAMSSSLEFPFVPRNLNGENPLTPSHPPLILLATRAPPFLSFSKYFLLPVCTLRPVLGHVSHFQPLLSLESTILWKVIFQREKIFDIYFIT